MHTADEIRLQGNLYPREAVTARLARLEEALATDGNAPGTKIHVGYTQIKAQIADCRRALRTGTDEKPRSQRTWCFGCTRDGVNDPYKTCTVVNGKWLCRTHAAAEKKGRATEG